ncbi:MAG: type II toxin-antitoxin system RelE/ParE family toxin [Ectothiorhodospiraceae bacterium]|nr:type II toxin-antitoxin system RelE/ParE family toxin [Ectothiorhodospiraceae bacterium]
MKFAEFTEISIDRPELTADLRSFPVDRYVLYYRANTGGIELVRVLHGSRDINWVF